MKQRNWEAVILACCFIAPMGLAYADNLDQVHPMNIVRDSAITSLVRANLAAEHSVKLKDVKVETDDKGVVWLSGEADSQTSINLAEAIARNTSGVVAVRNQIIVKSN